MRTACLLVAACAVSGSITEDLDRDSDIWIGRDAIAMVFADGFESGGSLQRSVSVP